jgi:ketosteroid isomerase-like protein
MTLDLDRLMRLWDTPPGPAAEADFAALYRDPFVLNGTASTPAAMATMARALHTALTGQSREILETVVAGPDRLAVAFVVRGHHAGPLPTRLGAVAPSGRPVAMHVIDIFTVQDGLITEVRAVSDELGLLIGLDAVRLGTTR